MRISDWSSDVCSSDLSPSTRHAERRKITAINPPTMMSGQAEPVRPTNPAAARTPTFDATSLREHSNVLDMFTFSRRKRQGSARQIRFATRSDEHTSELQSLMRISYAVFCLKNKPHNHIIKKNIQN